MRLCRAIICAFGDHLNHRLRSRNACKATLRPRNHNGGSVACFPFSHGQGNCNGYQPDCNMKLSTETENLFAVLRQSAKPKPVSAIQKLIEDGPDRDLCRINVLA